MSFDIPIADSEGLNPVANTEKEPRDADIVFVHGLAGGSHSTWRHGQLGEAAHFFWPAALGEDLPQCGIWTVGYPAGITAMGKPGMIIDKRAGNLSQKLANAGLGTRPLLFITHSMGGLVVKSLIVGSQTLADADRKRLVSVVRGIVFLGAPHRGSAFADAARVLSAFLGGSQDHVDEMRANADPLDFLHDEFIEWHRRNPVSVESYAENIQLFRTRRLFPPLPLGLVVPRASANPGIAGHNIRDVDDDHLTLVKPRDRKHDVYAGVLRFVRSALASKSVQDLAVTPVPGPSAVPAADGEAEAGAAGAIGRPRVYLSYTLRTKDLRGRVFELAERLRRNGIDSRMDLFYAKSLHGFTPPDPVPHQDSWAFWQEEQVQQADRVLILCSKEFNESPEGSGAWFDVELMKRDVESGAALRKFIPVGFGDYESNQPFIPSFILGATYYDLTPGPIAGFGFEDLLRRFRTEFSSTSAAGGLGRVNRTTSTSQVEPPPAFDLERQGELLEPPAALLELSAPPARVVWKPVSMGLAIEVTNMQPRVMSRVQLIMKDPLWWSDAIGAFVESRDAYGVDEFEVGTASELFSGIPTTFSALRSIPGDSVVRIYGPITLEDFFEAPVKLRLTQHGRWSVGLRLKWDGGMYEQRLEFAWDGNVAVPVAAAGETAPLS